MANQVLLTSGLALSLALGLGSACGTTPSASGGDGGAPPSSSSGGSGGSSGNGSSSSGGVGSSSAGSSSSGGPAGSSSGSSGPSSSSSGGSSSSGSSSSGASSSSGSSSSGTAAGPGVTVYQTSAAGDHLANKGTLVIGASPPAGKSTIKVDVTAPKQTILGFGAALTESASSVIMGLPAAQQQEVINAYFSPTGSGYTLTRSHIGSCDFALSEYNYDNTAGDTALANFSIANDQKFIIPALKAALAASGGALRLLSSPWSAPGWMKDNGLMRGNGSDGSLLPANYATYAKYISKYITSYKAAGVPVWGITVQNEPLGVGGSREGMQWSDTQTNTFIRDNLGPQLKADGVGSTQIFFYDHNKGPTPGDAATTWAKTILGDAKTNPFVAGTAVHWYDSTFQTYPDELESIHAVDPTKMILFDEGTADNLGDISAGQSSATYQYSWMHDAFYWQKDDYDWGYWFSSRVTHPIYQPLYRYARDIIVGLNHWYAGFLDWNAILNKDGGPGHVRNPCPAGILVDGTTLYYTPIFYTMQHFSKFIRPQAQVLTTTVTLAPGTPISDYDGTPTQDGSALIAVGVQNPDKSIAVVLFNETNAPIDYALVLGTQSVSTTVAAQAIQTVVWRQ